MFGVVPKPLWEKRIPADERNRIPLALRCLVIEHPDGLVLVDTGLGNKEDEKFCAIYGVENAGRDGPTQVEDALASVGFGPADVAWVINTHLHFDHAGGNTFIDAGDHATAALAFPHATYVVQRGELDFARHANERTRGSYFPKNFEPVAARDRWMLLDGDTEVLPGIVCVVTPGHVPFHQSIRVADGGETALFLGDLVPTSAHLPLPWIMGYDVEPLRTLETKRTVLAVAAEEGWRLVFEHDPVVAWGRARPPGAGAGAGAGLADIQSVEDSPPGPGER